MDLMKTGNRTDWLRRPNGIVKNHSLNLYVKSQRSGFSLSLAPTLINPCFHMDKNAILSIYMSVHIILVIIYTVYNNQWPVLFFLPSFLPASPLSLGR